MSILRRWGLPVLGHALTLLTLVVLACLLPRLMPGDPVTALWTQGSTAYVFDDGLRASLMNRYGLDRPLHAQVGTEVANLLRGEAGTSIRYQQPVADLVADRLPRTVLLVATAMALGIAVGVAVGACAGWRRGGFLDVAGLAGAAVVRAVPAFFLAAAALYLFAARLGWFPMSGAATPFSSGKSWWAVAADVAHHLALPALVLAVPVAAGQLLITRSSVLGQLRTGHLTGARARGASGHQILRWHVVPIAAAPIIALTGVQIAAVAGGALVVETVFAYPGVGALLVSGIAYRDYPLLQASFIVLGMIVVLGGLLADLALRLVDRRTGAA